MINYIKYNKYLLSNNTAKGDDILKNETLWIIEKVTCSSRLGYKLKSRKSNSYLKIENNGADLISTDDRNECKKTIWRIKYPKNESEKYLIFTTMSNSKMAKKKLTIDLEMEGGTVKEIGKNWKLVKGMSKCGLLNSVFSDGVRI